MSVWWKTDSISRHVTFELHNSSDVISINVLVERSRRQTEAPSEVRREFRVQPMRNTSEDKTSMYKCKYDAELISAYDHDSL